MTIREMDEQREEINKGIAELQMGYEEFDRNMKALKDYIDCLKRAFDELDRLRGAAQ